MKYFRLIFIFFFSQLSHKIYSQNIKDLDFELVENNIVLTFNVVDQNFLTCRNGACISSDNSLSPNFNNKTALNTNFNSITFSSNIFFKVLIDGYESESTKINLPYDILNNIKLGKNTIEIDIEKYLSDYIGFDIEFEFEVQIIDQPNFIPVYFETQTKTITLDKWDENKILQLLYWNLQYIKYKDLSNLSFKLIKNNKVYLEGYIDGEEKFKILKATPNSSNKWEDVYLIEMTNSGYSNDSYSDNIYLSKKEEIPKVVAKKEKKNPTRDKSGFGLFVNYSPDNNLNNTGYALPFSKNQSGYLPDVLFGIEGFITESKLSVGFMFGTEKSSFPNYDDDCDFGCLNNSLYALTLGSQIGKSPFIFKVALGGYSYNYEIEDSFGAFYDYTSAFYGSAGLQLFLGRGNANGKARVTAEAYITTLGTIGYGMGLIF